MDLPVTDQWFIRERVDDDITLMTEPYVHPFLRCNIWHIRGRDRDLLIDTGMGISSLSLAAKDLFGKQLTVAITHSHIDHSGGAHEFDGCLAHRHEIDNLKQAKDTLPLEVKYWPKKALEMMEVDGPVGDLLITARPSMDFIPEKFELKTASPAAAIDEGHIIDLGNRSFEVLHLPGHSPGSIGLWEEKTGTLFSGDAIYDAHLLDELYGSDKQVYRKTMERLIDLPVTVVHGGHAGSFGRERLQKIAHAYLDGKQLEYNL